MLITRTLTAKPPKRAAYFLSKKRLSFASAHDLRRLSAFADRHTSVCRRLLVERSFPRSHHSALLKTAKPPKRAAYFFEQETIVLR